MMGAVAALLAVVAVVCLAVAVAQSRRADRFVLALLERDVEHRNSRAELVQAFLDEQRREQQRHEAEQVRWRDERGELLNAALAAATTQPVQIAPAWATGSPDKLYRTEEDEVLAARAQTAAQIQTALDARPPLLGDMGVAV